MIRRLIPVLDQPLSVVGLGCFAIGGYMWGAQDDVDSRDAMAAALAAGINWIDTAPLYGDGHAERVLGAFLRQIPGSERPLIATKFGHVVQADGSRLSRAGREDVLADCEASLQHLGVETIDLYQQHWPAPEPLEETAQALHSLVAAGKVRAIGISNVGVDDIRAWQDTGLPLATVQNGYSLFRRSDEADVLPYCAANDLAYLAYSPMHRGMLFGTWNADHHFPPGDHRRERPDFVAPRFPVLLQGVARLRAIAEAHDLSLAQLAVGALLSREGCTAVIIGARNHAQGVALQTLGMPLKRAVCEQIEEVLMRVDAELATL
ncbi:MAG: aldo/keto reductase [Planctomycetota bacterium]|nr:MAG: aldo/keto reductase [Planctomycetota bacterium]